MVVVYCLGGLQATVELRRWRQLRVKYEGVELGEKCGGNYDRENKIEKGIGRGRVVVERRRVKEARTLGVRQCYLWLRDPELLVCPAT